MIDKQTAGKRNLPFRILDKSINGLFGFIICCIIIVNLVSFFLIGFSYGMAILFGTLLFAAAGFVLIKTKLYRNKRFWLIVFILGVVARLLYGFFNQVELESDMLYCYNAAVSTTQGDLSWLSEPYFHLHYPYQIPFVYYEALILTVFRTVRALYVFDALWSVLMCLLIYKITERISKNLLIALILASAYTWLPSSLLKIGNLYNFSVSGVLLLAGVYCFILAIERVKEARGFLRMGLLLSLASGILISISCLFRQEGSIVLIAGVCYYIYFLLSYKKKSEHDLKNQFTVHILNGIISMAVLILSFLLVNNVAEMIFRANGIESIGMGGAAYWQIVCGMTPDEYGQYCPKYHWICDIADPADQKLAFEKIMGEIFSGRSPLDVLRFFVQKIYHMWGVPDSGFGIGFESFFERVFTVACLALDKALYLLFLGLSLLGVKYKDDNMYHEKAFLTIGFIGFFLAYMIKEAGTRYRYDPILMLVLLSVFGLMVINKKKKVF